MQVTNRMGLVQGQLLNAAIADSVDLGARNDPTVAAQVVLNLSAKGEAAYAAAAAAAPGPHRTQEFQNAFGLLTRALALTRNLSPSLGPERRRLSTPSAPPTTTASRSACSSPHSSSRSRSRRT